jgi:tripartite-type tricarboxylate transporter receptor subunit TctC
MTNYFINAAPSDGTVIGMGTSNVPYEPRLRLMSADGKNSNWDPRHLSWIGTPVREPQISWVWGASGIRSWEDMRTIPTRFGSTTIGGDNSIFPMLANNLLGLKSEVITGYQGSNDVFLAIERGELNASNTAYSNLIIQKPDWMQSGKAKIVMQFGLERVPSLPDVPSLIELVKNKDDEQMLRFLLMKFEMHRPIYGPPSIPKDRLAALRNAFDKAVVDPDFMEEARKMGLELRPLSGAPIEKMVDEIMETPEPIVTRVRDTLNALAN